MRTTISTSTACSCASRSKRAYSASFSVVEKLLGAKTVETAIQIQTEYAKSAYESFIAGATRIGELYADLTKETYKPFEAYIGKVNGR